MSKEEIKQALSEYFGITGENKRFFDATQIPRICNDLSDIRRAIESMKDKLDDKYVLKSEYTLIRNIVLGACGLILASVLTALIYLVVK